MTADIHAINLAEKFAAFHDHNRHRIVGELNGQYVKLTRCLGQFIWHYHENEDELFFVIRGTLKVELHTHTVMVNEGEFVIVPKGVEHRTSADAETLLMLFEPVTTVNTGNVENEMTLRELERL